MLINKLEVENFKLFAKQEFNFHPNFNLVIGENGSGKTSLLRALAVALGGWAHAYIKNKNNLRPITDDEMREIQIDKRFDKTKNTFIKAIGSAEIIDRYTNRKTGWATWTRKRLENTTETSTYGDIQYGSHPKSYNLNFNALGSDILSYIERGGNFNLPLMAFYECDRLWLPKNELNIESAAKAKYSRFDPYIDCFHTAADHQAVGEWLLKHELASIQQGRETAILQSIRHAAKAALENCTGLKFDFEQGLVMVEFENNMTVPFGHLSDGQRTMLGLFCDLARRAAILNPHLEGSASLKTQGVVLIDELDLHLHPKWQRRIIEDLRKTFPKIQFICTTHSPFLIQSLHSGDELIMLDGQPTAQLANKSLEEIAQGIMGVKNPEVAERYMEMKTVAKHYLETLEEAAISPEEKLEAFKQRLADSIALYADNPAFQAILEMERIAKLGE
jgi:predicted ATP-binding protein involved in virulence